MRKRSPMRWVKGYGSMVRSGPWPQWGRESLSNRMCDHLGEMVHGTVEDALTAMLDAEADRLCGGRKYERTEGRKDMRGGR